VRNQLGGIRRVSAVKRQVRQGGQKSRGVNLSGQVLRRAVKSFLPLEEGMQSASNGESNRTKPSLPPELSESRRRERKASKFPAVPSGKTMKIYD